MLHKLAFWHQDLVSLWPLAVGHQRAQPARILAQHIEQVSKPHCIQASSKVGHAARSRRPGPGRGAQVGVGAQWGHKECGMRLLAAAPAVMQRLMLDVPAVRLLARSPTCPLHVWQPPPAGTSREGIAMSSAQLTRKGATPPRCPNRRQARPGTCERLLGTSRCPLTSWRCPLSE